LDDPENDSLEYIDLCSPLLAIQAPKPVTQPEMSTLQAQMSHQIQIIKEMPKQVRHDKSVILNSFQNLILNFGIHLTFACLPRASTVRGLPVGREFEIWI
jgi:hypothetical protein